MDAELTLGRYRQRLCIERAPAEPVTGRWCERGAGHGGPHIVHAGRRIVRWTSPGYGEDMVLPEGRL